ncbi:MAG TPA: hypothetical protein VF159_05015 [Gemmatimonadaceae bacterium]
MSTVSRCLSAGAFALAFAGVAAGQSSVAVSPFVSYVPSAASNPLLGMALTFGGTTGLAFRGSGDMSISTPSPTANSADPSAPAAAGVRPWAADADAVLFLGGLGGGATMFSHTLAPYLFTGLGVVGGDSSGHNVVHNGWGYGAGATIPLGLDADLFGEARWRMSRYVLPTSKGAPDSKSELRFGLAFHVGGSSQPDRRDRRPRRYRDDEDADYATSRAPVAPAAAPIIVQAPAPVIVQAPPPTVIAAPPPQQQVIVVPQSEPANVTRINVNLPGSMHWPWGSSRQRANDRQRQRDDNRVQSGTAGTTVTVIRPRRRERRP